MSRVRKSERAAVPIETADEKGHLREGFPLLAGRSANQNDGEPSGLARAKRRAGLTPFWIAFAVSLAWILLATFDLANSASTGNPGVIAAGGSPLSFLELAGVLIRLLVPVLLIWAAAHMIYRSRQMELVTQNFISASSAMLREQGPAPAARWRVPKGGEEAQGALLALQEQTSRALQAEELIGHALADVERAFGRNSERVQTLVGSLGNQCMAMQNLSDQLGNDAVPLMNHLQETTAHLQSVLDQNGSLLSRLGTDVAQATDILASSLSDLTGGTAKFGQEISMQTSRIDQMTATLQGEAVSFSQRLDNQVRMLAQSTVELNSEASEFSAVIDRIENRISNLFRSAVVELSGMHDQIETTLGLRSSSVSDAIVASASRVSEALDRLKGTVTGELRESADELAKQVIVNATAAAEDLRASGGHIKDELEAFARDFIQTFRRMGKPLPARAEESSTGMGGTLEELTTGLATRIDDHSNDLLEKFAERTLSVVSELESASGEIAKKLNDTSNRYTDLIETTAAKVGGSLVSTSEQVTSALNEASGDLSKTLESTAGKVTGRISQTASSATQKLQTVAGGAAEELDQLGKLVAVLSQRLEASTADIAGEIKGTGDGITRTVQGASDQFRALMETNRVHFADSTGETQAQFIAFMEEFARNYLERGESSRRQILESFDQVQENVVERIEGATREFGTRLSDSVADYALRVGLATTNLSSAFNAKADELAQGFDSNVAKTFERIGSKAGSLSS